MALDTHSEVVKAVVIESVQAPPQVGSTVKHYELLRKLGEGGMGTVYLARDTMLGRLVAIKVLHMRSGPSTERFLIEAQATARCRHDNIVVIHEVDEFHGCLYMVLEYLEGRTLREWMTQSARPADDEISAEAHAEVVSPSLAVELVIPVVRALACAHQLGIVHRDLKPENIFLTDGGRVVVLDFGIAKRIAASEIAAFAPTARPREHGRLTQDGALLGTMPYMSPEQLRSENIDARSDLWAVGILLFELVTGAHPLAHCSVLDLLDVGDSDEPMPSVFDRRPDIGALGAIIDRCLRKPRDQRHRSAEELLAALQALAPGGQRARGEDESPFAGLSAFQEADAGSYVGREREVAGVTGRLRKQPLVVVVGPSGAGKSSFVRAGVIPALKRSGEPWETFILRPGRRPLAQLVDVLAQLAANGDAAASGSDERAPEVSLRDLQTQPGLLGARLRARCRGERAPRRILLYVDQFEELYTLGADAAERAAFVACLEGAADDASSPLRVMLSLRSDFLDRMAGEGHLLAETARGLFLLRPMEREGLREALVRPLAAAGYRFENEAMIDAMLDGLEHTRSPLPLLQFTAARLWETRDRESRCLTQASYDGSGGVAGALSAHADAVLSSLSSIEQHLCRTIFLRLCTPERTRAVVSLAELHADAADGGAAELVIRRLVDARLVVIEGGGEREGTTVELCHESLIESWDKLQQWLAESQRDMRFFARLQGAAHQWETGHAAEGLLWRDSAAREAADWLARRRAIQGDGRPLGLSPREERFLLAVIALSERTRRRRRRLMASGLITVSVVAAVVFALSLSVRRQAVAAQLEARQARNATRMASARELEENDPTTMLALLREVEPPGVPRGWDELVSKALRSALAREVRFWGVTVYGAAWSPDGRHIVAALHDRTARVWRVGYPGEPIVLRGHDAPVLTPGFSPDGTRIVTASMDSTVRVWSADGSGEPIVLRGHTGTIWRAAFSPEGTRIVSAAGDRTARVWNADGTGQPVILRGHEAIVYAAAWSPDGQRIVTGSVDRTARVWKADGSGEPLVLRHPGAVLSAAFSPDGRHIVTGSEDKAVRVWTADGSGEPRVLHGHEAHVIGAAFSPDGTRIATASMDRTVRVWSADGRGEPLVLRGHENFVYSAAWSPDGASIVTASLDQTTRVFRFDLLRASAPVLLGAHEGRLSAVAFSPDNQRVVTASADHIARVWRADGAGLPVVLRGHEAPVQAAVFSPDNQRVVTVATDRTARVWRADGARQPVVLRASDSSITMAQFSPDSQRVVTVSNDRLVRVWRADGAGSPLVLRGHERAIAWARFSPDGRYIATGSEDRTVRLWPSDGAGLPQVYAVESGFPVHAWSPDSKRIAIECRDHAMCVWSIGTSRDPVILRGHDQQPTSATWSQDSKRIATGSRDATVRVWNADGAGRPVVLRGHRGGLTIVRFSPDGTRVVSEATDETVRVWNADGSGEPYVLRPSEGQTLASSAVSPDATRVAGGIPFDTAWVRRLLAPLGGVDDPRLWSATPYCLSVERRISLLSVPEARARADQDGCERRVRAMATMP